MVHLYRGEMNRLTVWRKRLDVTSNWAILLTFGLTTFTLGDPHIPHFILLLGIALLVISLLIEARRYRHLHHSKWRVHTLEAGYFAPLLEDGGPDDGAWRRMLAADLKSPHLQIGWWCAIRVRLRRNYLLLLYLITAVWLTKIFIHPASPHSTGELYGRFAVGELLPPWFVMASAVVFVVAASLVAFTCPSGEEVEFWGR